MSWPAVIATGSITLALISYFKTPDHSFRLTMEVETSEGVRKASGTIHVWVASGIGILPGVGGGTSISGDALFVDLGPGKNVVALLARGAGAAYVDGIGVLARDAIERSSGRDLSVHEVHKVSGRFPLRGDLVPTLMSFSDPKNPLSGRPLAADGSAIGGGESFKVSAVYIDMIPASLWPLNWLGIYGEPVTRRITDHLPWLGNHPDEIAAWRALIQFRTVGPSGGPDLLFRRN